MVPAYRPRVGCARIRLVRCTQWKSLLLPSAWGGPEAWEGHTFSQSWLEEEEASSENHGRARVGEEELLCGLPLQSAGDIAKGTEKSP